MSSNLYIPRTLWSGDKIYGEEELLAASRHVIVLGEPGSGKSEVMRSFAQQLETEAVSASLFRYSGANKENLPLVIDAFDELAQVESAGIFELLARVKKASPTHVYKLKADLRS